MSVHVVSTTHDLGPGLLPTPFTAAEIRDATGAGKTIRMLVEGPGDSRVERVNRFTECDAEGATLTRWRVGDDDTAVERSSGRVTWNELQAHAGFAADRTTVTDEVVELPLGEVECRRYDVTETPDAPTETFWFALAFPGMPARYELSTPDGMVRTTVLAIERD